MKTILLAALIACLMGCGERVSRQKARNIIIMIPDGMGLSDVTAARIFKGGADGEPLAFETLPQIGYQRTHSEDCTVTDSAAAASAWATGDKYKNGQISWHGEGEHPTTILEIAKARGKATGLVATTDITHATPAAFAAHVSTRKSEGEIARQLIEVTGVDVLLGGGLNNNHGNSPLPKENIEQLIANATNQYGYALASTHSEMERLVTSDKVLGLFKPGNKTIETFRVDPDSTYPPKEPTLPQMTETALEILSRDPDGFFLMVEGSQVDKRNHLNDLEGMIAEMLAFDEAVAVVKEWLAQNPARQSETLLIVVPDHETGGFMINGPKQLLSDPGEWVEAGWTTKGHTAVDSIIWSAGPGSEALGGAMDNTDLFYVMEQVLQ